MRPTIMKISTDTVRENARVLRDNLPENVHMMCVIKANGYGHDSVRVAGGNLPIVSGKEAIRAKNESDATLFVKHLREEWTDLGLEAQALAAIVLPVLPRRLPGKRPYAKLWLAGFCFWFYVTHFVRFPHWINYGLWVALGAYLGVYLPLFVGCARRLYHRRLPRLFSQFSGRARRCPSGNRYHIPASF